MGRDFKKRKESEEHARGSSGTVKKNKTPVDIDEIYSYLLEKYSFLTLGHFFRLSCPRGGLTPNQINCLYEKALEREYNNNRIVGAMHGAKIPPLKEDPKKKEDKYKDWTEEEKKAETDRQMAQFQKMFGGKIEIIDNRKNKEVS